MTEAKTLTKEDFLKLFKDNNDKRKFYIGNVQEYAYGLPNEKAFCFSRMIPKEVIDEVYKGQRGSKFSDTVLDFWSSLDKDIAKQTIQIKELEEKFLNTDGHMLINLIGGS